MRLFFLFFYSPAPIIPGLFAAFPKAFYPVINPDNRE